MGDRLDLPSVSVIVPALNQGCFIEDCLLSILGQGYPNLETIVIDGGSSDNTVDILERYSGQLAYWHSRKDKGQADAINQGMARATGDVLCWLNSDDMYLPGTLLEVGARFVNRTKENLLLFGSVMCFVEGKLFSCWPQYGEPLEEFKLTYTDYIRQPATFWTRKLWEEAGQLEDKYNYVLDWEWFVRASKVGSFEYIRKFYAIYRFHESHKTGTGKDKRREEIRAVVERYSSEYWSRLYIEVENQYPGLRRRARAIQRMNMSDGRKRLLLSFFYPGLRLYYRRFHDLVTVLDMYEG